MANRCVHNAASNIESKQCRHSLRNCAAQSVTFVQRGSVAQKSPIRTSSVLLTSRLHLAYIVYTRGAVASLHLNKATLPSYTLHYIKFKLKNAEALLRTP